MRAFFYWLHVTSCWRHLVRIVFKIFIYLIPLVLKYTYTLPDSACTQVHLYSTWFRLYSSAPILYLIPLVLKNTYTLPDSACTQVRLYSTWFHLYSSTPILYLIPLVPGLYSSAPILYLYLLWLLLDVFLDNGALIHLELHVNLRKEFIKKFFRLMSS